MRSKRDWVDEEGEYEAENTENAVGVRLCPFCENGQEAKEK